MKLSWFPFDRGCEGTISRVSVWCGWEGNAKSTGTSLSPNRLYRIPFDFGAEHVKQCAHSHHVWSCLGGAGTSWGVGSKARTLPKMAGAGRGLNKPPHSCYESPGNEADVSRIQVQGLEEEIREHEEVRPHHFTKFFNGIICMFWCMFFL